MSDTILTEVGSRRALGDQAFFHIAQVLSDLSPKLSRLEHKIFSPTGITDRRTTATLVQRPGYVPRRGTGTARAAARPFHTSRTMAKLSTAPVDALNPWSTRAAVSSSMLGASSAFR